MDPLDLAVVGAGAAGTWLAHAMQQARPAWSITLFERHQRIGGRLHSVQVPGVRHPIELGGMRYVTSHRLVQAVVDGFDIPRVRSISTANPIAPTCAVPSVAGHRTPPQAPATTWLRTSAATTVSGTHTDALAHDAIGVEERVRRMAQRDRDQEIS